MVNRDGLDEPLENDREAKRTVVSEDAYQYLTASRALSLTHTTTASTATSSRLAFHSDQYPSHVRMCSECAASADTIDDYW